MLADQIPGRDDDSARAAHLLRQYGPYRPQIPAVCPVCDEWNLAARAIIPGELTHWKCPCGHEGIADIAAPFVLPIDRLAYQQA